jgi:hypothetical protein
MRIGRGDLRPHTHAKILRLRWQGGDKGGEQ